MQLKSGIWRVGCAICLVFDIGLDTDVSLHMSFALCRAWQFACIVLSSSKSVAYLVTCFFITSATQSLPLPVSDVISLDAYMAYCMCIGYALHRGSELQLTFNKRFHANVE